MPRPAPDTTITQRVVEAAVRAAAAGEAWDHRDPECKGHSLRVKGERMSWTFRGRLDGKNGRWELGGADVPPKEARFRAGKVRELVSRGLDPTTLITELVTGIKAEAQVIVEAPKPSWVWHSAVEKFIAYMTENGRRATVKDYRGTLQNTAELKKFALRRVSDILREEIEEAVEAVRKRGVKTHHKKVLVVTRRFFNWLAEGSRRRETGVPPNFLLGAKAAPYIRIDPNDPSAPTRRKVNKGIPPASSIGRALAIARSGALPLLPSLGIQLVIGTVQRRRAIVGFNSFDVRPLSGPDRSWVWFQPPAFRKTADNLQSESAHQVPIVGWVSGVYDVLERRRSYENKEGWLFPVSRARKKGDQPLQPHMSEGVLNKNIDCMPGLDDALSPQALRRGFASFGKKFLGFADGEAKMVLDHMEGEGGNVTRNHYDLDPRIERKTEMMLAWARFCDEQATEEIAADPLLRDLDALREAIYRQRYDEEAWQRKLALVRKSGRPLWGDDAEELPEAAE
jgi:hypothetical protein